MKSGSGHSVNLTCSVVETLSPCLGLSGFSQVLVPLVLGTVQRGWMLFPGAKQALGLRPAVMVLCWHVQGATRMDPVVWLSLLIL